MRLLAQGRITEQEFDAERNRVQAALAAVRGELSALDQGGAGQLSYLDVALAFCGQMGNLWRRSDVAHRKAIAHLVFKRISIDNAGDVVDYRLATPFGYLAQQKKRLLPA